MIEPPTAPTKLAVTIRPRKRTRVPLTVTATGYASTRTMYRVIIYRASHQTNAVMLRETSLLAPTRIRLKERENVRHLHPATSPLETTGTWYTTFLKLETRLRRSSRRRASPLMANPAMLSHRLAWPRIEPGGDDVSSSEYELC